MKKKKKRIRIKPVQLMQEAEKIACFHAMHLCVTQAKKDRVYVYEVFNAYQDFLTNNNLQDTPLTLDGFGRMLHITLPRKVMKIGKGPIARGFVGLKITSVSGKLS